MNNNSDIDINSDNSSDSDNSQDDEIQNIKINNKDINIQNNSLSTIYNNYLVRNSVNLHLIYQRSLSWT